MTMEGERRQISAADFELLLKKFESEESKVKVRFVGSAPEFTCAIEGFVSSVHEARVIIRDETKHCEMVFQIEESWQCSYLESKDFPEELKRPFKLLSEFARAEGFPDVTKGEMPFESGVDCFIPGKGRLSVLEMR